MCPVSLRAGGRYGDGYASVGGVLRLGEPGARQPERIRQVADSIAASKKELGRMSSEAA